MDLHTRNVTLTGEQLVHLLAAAFTEGVVHALRRGADTPHPLVGDDFDAAAQSALQLIERTEPGIWITSR